MRILRIVGCVAAAAVVVACSSSNGGGNGNAAAGNAAGACTTVSPNACTDGCNPCSRLSDAQVAAVVGRPAVPGQWDSDACLWDFTDDKGDPSFEVGLHINTDYATFQDLCHPGGAPVDGITITPVSGVGDDACTITTPAGKLGSFNLELLKGCWAYSVTVAGPVGKAPPFPDATAQAYEKALALDVVPNL